MEETLREQIEAWDKGDTVWTVEMGGLGPGYEQALQIAAIEMGRVMIPYAPGTNREQNVALFKQVTENANIKGLGLSGAQHGAAQQIAFNWWTKGPAKFCEFYKSKSLGDRCVMISKDWPQAPEPPATPNQSKHT